MIYEDVIFKDVFKNEDMYFGLIQFVQSIIKKHVKDIVILDSNLIQEDEKIFSIHLLMKVDDVTLWLVFAFGEEREYEKEEYFCQTNEGRKLYDVAPTIRYNINKIISYCKDKNRQKVKEFLFIIELFIKLLDLDGVKVK